ncbi:MAG: bifunctional DNA-formamidopyrimidine glycosylase/DNA-(apurinic or apyrimidinic site) lyase [Candidatus Moraniibacteriota bacterium]
MPELPEVQTVVSQLGRKITGKRIAGFWSDWEKQVKPGMKVLATLAIGGVVLGTRRIGKHVVIDLDNARSLVVHLKMSGHLLYKDATNKSAKEWKDPMNRFIHHRIDFTDGSWIDFSDLRKFGWIDCAATAEVEVMKSIASLGCDALAGKCDLDFFAALLKRSRRKRIATLLLEQDKIAGIGNIYRSEMLYRAGIRPLRLIGKITKAERTRLFAAMKAVLREAVRLRGTTDGDFRDTAGKPGGFQRTLAVYGRAGLPCKRCDTIIVRKKLGQRSVFYCPACQK